MGPNACDSALNPISAAVGRIGSHPPRLASAVRRLFGELAANEQSGWSQLGRGLSGRRRPRPRCSIRRTMTIRRATSRSWSISAAFGWNACAASATCGWPGGCGVCWAWTRCCQIFGRSRDAKKCLWPTVAVILTIARFCRGVERITHRDDVVSRARPCRELVGHIDRRRSTPTGSDAGLDWLLPHKSHHRQASERSPRMGCSTWNTKCPVVRRDQHVFRGPMPRRTASRRKRVMFSPRRAA